jgi:hypothetical protein
VASRLNTTEKASTETCISAGLLCEVLSVLPEQTILRYLELVLRQQTSIDHFSEGYKSLRKRLRSVGGLIRRITHSLA